jgi:hypothetical protein
MATFEKEKGLAVVQAAGERSDGPWGSAAVGKPHAFERGQTLGEISEKFGGDFAANARCAPA